MTEHEEETSEEVKRPLREDRGPGLLGAAGAAAAPGSCQVRIPAAVPPSRARQPPARGRRGGRPDRSAVVTDAKSTARLRHDAHLARAAQHRRPRRRGTAGRKPGAAGTSRATATRRGVQSSRPRGPQNCPPSSCTHDHEAAQRRHGQHGLWPAQPHTERTREGARFHAEPGHSHRHGQRASPEHTHAQLGTAVCRRLARPPPTRGAAPPEAWSGCGERQARGTCSDTQHQGHATASHMARARHRGAWQTHRPVPSLSQGGGGAPGHTREGRGRTMRLPPWSGSPMLPPEVAPQPQTQVPAGSRGRASSVWSPAPRQRSGQDD